MSTNWRAGLGKFAIEIALGGVTISCWESMVSAQIIPDETLGAESSVVTPDNIKGLESERISGGAVRGSNLFHSFREFNIGEGRGGYFENPTAIENIFSRVTGINPSEIFGTLGVLGNANLFFLNPNGIIFGQNASLDVRGSFLGTTADSIVFPDGKQFSATNPGVPPLLTVNVQQPIGLQFEGESGIITNAADLAVASGQTLTLSGGTVTSTGSLIAPGGTVMMLGELVGLLENAQIDVSSETGGGTVLIGGDVQGQGSVPNAARTYIGPDVTINADALTNGNGGRVIIFAEETAQIYGNITARGGLLGGNGGFVETSGKQNLRMTTFPDVSAPAGLGGEWLIDPNNIEIVAGNGNTNINNTNPFESINDGAKLGVNLIQNALTGGANVTVTTSTGGANTQDGNITWNAALDFNGTGTNSLTLNAANNININADLTDSVSGNDSLNLTLNADFDDLNGGAVNISSAKINLGNGDFTAIGRGNSTLNHGITLDNNSSIITGGNIEITGTGNAGRARNNYGIFINNNSSIEASESVSIKLIGTGGGDGTGISNRGIYLLNGGRVESTGNATITLDGTGGNGTDFNDGIRIDNGQVISETGDINLTGNGGGDGTGISNRGIYLLNGSRVESSGEGNSGDIIIKTPILEMLNNGDISASVFGKGNSGAVQINATEKVTISGDSDIFSSVAVGGEGNSGSIIINTSILEMLDNGNISASVLGKGNSGTVQINATEKVTISDRSDILNRVGEDGVGNSGGIIINTPTLEMLDDGDISASVFGEGDSGTVQINATEKVTISGDSDIFSSVAVGGEGNSGSIIINTPTLEMLDDGNIGARVRGKGNSGDIIINTSILEMLDDGDISASVFGEGESGTVQINATEKVTISGDSDIFSSVAVGGVGDSGGIIINTSILEMLNGGNIGARVRGKGNSGDIIINTSILEMLDDGNISASVFGEGESGTVKINATEKVTISGSSDIFNQVGENGEGNSGGIIINTPILEMLDNGDISTSTFGEGNAGLVQITASKGITISGDSEIFSQVNNGAEGRSEGIIIDTSTLSLTNEGRISTSTSGKGDAGDITIDTGSLLVTDRARVLSRNNGGQGNAGSVTITAEDTVTIAGFRGNGDAIVGSDVARDGIGNGNDLNITAREIYIQDNAIVAASIIYGKGENGTPAQSGNVTIKAKERVSISNNSVVFSEVGGNSVGNGGTINISAPIVSLEGSSVNTQIREGGKGKAGDINIFETELLQVTDGGQLATITSGQGNAGNINISDSKNVIFDGVGNNRWAIQNPLYGVNDRIPDSSGAFSTVESTAVGKAGGITIDTSSLSITDGAVVSARTEGKGEAGNIAITANILEATSGSQIQTDTTTNFDAADINLEIRDSLFLSGTESGLFAQTEGAGDAGKITINTAQLIIDQGASISAFTEASGDGGTINVNAPQEVLLTDNSKLTVETSGAGKPGDIFITTPNLTIGKDAEISATATETSTNKEKGGGITINSANLDLTGKLGIFAETQGEASAGTLNLQPDNNKPNLDIQFTDTAIISASTTASGTGGNINLTAPETINLTGQGKVAVETRGIGDAGSINITTEELNINNQTEISASTFRSGQAGDIKITANNLNLTEDATIITNTASSGQAGDIQLHIRDNLNLVNSTIAASTQEQSTGNGGSIFIGSQVVTLNNSQIAVNSQGQGTGGDITLQANALTLANHSAITAETFSTDGGNIEIALGGNLVLRDHSQISASAGTAEAGGNGGNITIDGSFIIAFPQENSDITANAFEGDGGNITINANGIFGIEFRDQETPLSDITASSEFGRQGEVEINTSGIDPTRGLDNLPQETVEVEVAQGCQTTGGQSTLEFFAIGRGGLPPSPDDLFSSEIVIAEWIPLEFADEKVQEQTLEGSFTEDEITNLTLLTNLSCRRRK